MKDRAKSLLRRIMPVFSVLAVISLAGCIIAYPATENTSIAPQIPPTQESSDNITTFQPAPTIEAIKSYELPVIILFQAKPDHAYAGSMIELIWETSNTDSVSIDWGDNKKEFTSGTGSEVVQPVIKTSYILIARNSNGVSVAQTEVTIDRDVTMGAYGVGGGVGGGACG